MNPDLLAWLPELVQTILHLEALKQSGVLSSDEATGKAVAFMRQAKPEHLQQLGKTITALQQSGILPMAINWPPEILAMLNGEPPTEQVTIQ